jgi:tetratricopeptide (TPR) repeat protein
VVHPVQTQAVTYIVQRLASLATLFYLGAVVCYAQGRHKELETGDRSSLSPVPCALCPYLWFFLAVISGLLAIRTKETAATLPLTVLLYEVVFHGATGRKLKVLAGVAGAALVVVGGMAMLGRLDVGQLAEGLRASSSAISRVDYLVTQFAAVASYLRLLVLPVGQNLDYDYPVYTSLLQVQPLLGLLLHLSLIGVALWAWHKAQGARHRGEASSPDVPLCPAPCALRLVSFGILWFYLTLAVESGLIPIQDVIAEHRLYLPSAGILMAGAAAGSLLSARIGRRRLAVAVSVVVLCLTVATVKRNLVWRSEESLWRDVAEKSPHKPRVLLTLGNMEAKRGNADGALVFYLRAVERDPTYFMAHLNIGIVLLQRGAADEAIGHLQTARNLAPDRAAIYYQLGRAYAAKGMTNNSITFFARAVDLAPGNGEYRQEINGKTTETRCKAATPPAGRGKNAEVPCSTAHRHLCRRCLRKHLLRPFCTR